MYCPSGNGDFTVCRFILLLECLLLGECSGLCIFQTIFFAKSESYWCCRSQNAVVELSQCPVPCYQRDNCSQCLDDRGRCVWCEATQVGTLYSLGSELPMLWISIHLYRFFPYIWKLEYTSFYTFIVIVTCIFQHGLIWIVAFMQM